MKNDLIMKKIGRLTLDVLAERMSRINKDDLCCFVGGQSIYTIEEYYEMVANGTWNGGFVKGWGYTNPDTIIDGKNPNYNFYRNHTDGNHKVMYESGYGAGYSGATYYYIMNQIGYSMSGDHDGAPNMDLYYWLRGYEDGKSDREEGYRSYY